MRLERLDLVRFGHFSDFSLDLGPAGGPGFHVIVGPNEAGKSTLVEAWLNLLYGIPINTSYAFRHPRSTLEIRALVDDGAGPVTLARTPQRTNNLLDDSGAPVPPALLTAMLRGVSDEAYRALYCLDDETIEKGGEDILASKGDLGQLLFSAASGMEAFSADLEAEREADRAFHRRGQGQRSTEVYRTKKALEDLKRERDANDLTAAEYRRLRREVDAAASADRDARTRHQELTLEDARLRARLMARPVKADLDEMAARLAALGDLPEIAENAEAEIATLAEQRAEHLNTLRTRRADLAAKAAECEGIVVEDAAAALPGLLADLSGRRSRAEADAEDLPRRRDDAAARHGRVLRILGDLGLAATDPATLHLPRPALEALDRAVRARDLAAQRAAQARTECDRAGQVLAAATAEAEAAEEGGEIVDPAPLRELLAGGSLAGLSEDLAASMRAHGETASAARSAREALSVGTVAFAACPDVPLTPDAAQALADRIRDLETCARQVRDRLAEDRDGIARLQARASALAGQGTDLSDAAANAARSRRETLWQAHRAALTGSTADAFAGALADEDALKAQRLADSARLGELRRLELDEAEANASLTGRERDLARLEKDLSAAGAELAGFLKAIGLPSTMGAAAFALWLTDHARVAAAERAEQATARAVAELRERSAPSWRTLTDTLGDSAPTDPVALVRAAEVRLAELEAQAKGRESARRAVIAARDDLATRSETAEAADASLSTAAGDLDNAFAALHLALPDGLDLADALPVLRDLAAECEALSGLTERIDKLERNAADFADAVAGMAAPWPELAGSPPLAQAASLDRIAETARRDLDRRERLAGEIDEAARQIARAERDLVETDTAAAHLAAVFAEPPEDFEAIRTAIAGAAEAGRLRVAIGKARARLCSLLNVPADQAQADLEGMSEGDLQMRLDLLAPDLDAAGDARDQAIRSRARAEDALKATGGDDEAARLAQDRRTVLEELRASTEAGLTRRLALMLSDRALARYRDRHRSAMLADTAETFADLTGGAYPALAAKSNEKGEVLIAQRASDGHSLRADEASMSKGTRFQLYLALRLAGYRQMAADGTTLPFLCDDVFETFDEDRTAAACRLLHRIGDIGQALYFTHHAHVAEIARAQCGDGVVVHRI